MIDHAGTALGVRPFSIDADRLAGLLVWFVSLPCELTRVGIEGSNGWGRHVAVHPVAAGFDVWDVPGGRPAERRRRLRPKIGREDS